MKPNACTLLLFSFLAVGASAEAGETDSGKQLYMQYCSFCHGMDDRGNGSVSPYLKIKVPDLTLLKKNNKGIYPMSKVMSAIDGSRVVRGHGDREMPVWEKFFAREPKAQSIVSLRHSLR